MEMPILEMIFKRPFLMPLRYCFIARFGARSSSPLRQRSASTA